MRSIFDQYQQPENRLTQASMSSLAATYDSAAALAITSGDLSYFRFRIR